MAVVSAWPWLRLGGRLCPPVQDYHEHALAACFLVQHSNEKDHKGMSKHLLIEYVALCGVAFPVRFMALIAVAMVHNNSAASGREVRAEALLEVPACTTTWDLNRSRSSISGRSSRRAMAAPEPILKDVMTTPSC